MSATRICILLTALGLSAAPAALAQRAALGRYDRPSENGPSGQLGRVGGALNLSNETFRARALAAMGPAGIPSFQGQRGIFAGIGRPTTRSPLLSQPRTEAGMNTRGDRRRQRPDYVGEFGRASRTDLMDLTNYSQYLSLSEDFGRLPPAFLPDRGAAFFAPPPDGNPYNAFFGLKSSGQPAVDSAAAVPGDETPAPFTAPLSTSELMQQTLDKSLDDLARSAAEAFRRGTTPSREDRFDELARATRLLESLRAQDRQAYLPSLLLVQAAMERGEGTTVIFNLFDLVKRNPGVFTNAPDMTAFYGDASLIEPTARRYLRSGEASGGSAHGFAMQAYAAWLIKDNARVAEAMIKLDERRKLEPDDPDLNRFVYAFASAHVAARP